MKKFFTKKVCIIALIILAIGALVFFLSRKKKTADAPEADEPEHDKVPVTDNPHTEDNEPSKPSDSQASPTIKPKKPYITDLSRLERPDKKVVNILSVDTKPGPTNGNRHISEPEGIVIRRKIKVGRK